MKKETYNQKAHSLSLVPILTQTKCSAQWCRSWYPQKFWIVEHLGKIQKNGPRNFNSFRWNYAFLLLNENYALLLLAKVHYVIKTIKYTVYKIKRKFCRIKDFRGHLGKIGQNILSTPENFPAPTPMVAHPSLHDNVDWIKYARSGDWKLLQSHIFLIISFSLLQPNTHKRLLLMTCNQAYR